MLVFLLKGHRTLNKEIKISFHDLNLPGNVWYLERLEEEQLWNDGSRRKAAEIIRLRSVCIPEEILGTNQLKGEIYKQVPHCNPADI